MIAEFITTIFKILNLRISNKKISIKYNVSINIFYNYTLIQRNHNYIGYACAETLVKLIIDEVETDLIKKKRIFDYLITFLSSTDKINFENFEDLVCNIVCKFVKKKSQFTKPIVINKNSYQKKVNESDTLRVVDIFELKKIGWSIRDYVIEATKLNYEVIENLTEEHNGEIEQLTSMITKHPENRRILLDENNKMIGYWSVEPLFDNFFYKAKNGELFDNELTADKIISLVVPGIYNVYFSSICLKNNYRKKHAFKKLLISLLDYIEELAVDGILINEICTLAYSDDGKSLSKTIGLKYHKNHIDYGEIYSGNIYDILSQPFCKNYDILKTIYNHI